MAEYIERKVVINRIKEYTLDVYDIDLDDAKQFGGNIRIENYCEGLYEATELVDDIPAADVAPVVHAHWQPYEDTVQCSACGFGTFMDGYFFVHGECTHADDCSFRFSFCPNCGAKMDEKED